MSTRMVFLPFVVFLCLATFAQVPEIISFQGRLADAGGTPITGVRDFVFRFYYAETGGTSIWTESQSGIEITNGLFTVMLGSVSPFGTGVDFSRQIWLSVEVGGTLLTPRYKLGASPYALRAVNANYAIEANFANSADVADAVAWSGITGMPPGFADGIDNEGASYTAGAGINITGSTISVADTGITTAKLANNAVTSVKIGNGEVTGEKINQMSATAGQVIKWNGTVWAPANDIGGGVGDDWGTQVVQHDASLTGQGIVGNLLGIANNGVQTTHIANSAVTAPKLASMGAGVGQILKWNGTTWTPANDSVGAGGTGLDQVHHTAVMTGRGTLTDPLDIAPSGIQTAHIADGGITTAKLANISVTAPKIGNREVTGEKINQMGATLGQVLKWDGSTWAPANDIGGGVGDDWGSQVVVSDATLGGNGTAGNPLKIADQGAAVGQVLKWTGTTWSPANDIGGGSGSPGGTNGQVQFNNAGAFGGATNLFYNNVLGRVGIGTNSPEARLHVRQTSDLELILEETSIYQPATIQFKNGSGGHFVVNGTPSTNSDSASLSIACFDGSSSFPIVNLVGSGKLGINNMEPKYALDVASNEYYKTAIKAYKWTGDETEAAIVGYSDMVRNMGALGGEMGDTVTEPFPNFNYGVYGKCTNTGWGGFGGMFYNTNGNWAGLAGDDGVGYDYAGYFHGNVKIQGDMTLSGIFHDSSNDPGTPGQILSSTGTGTNWIDPAVGTSLWIDAGDYLRPAGPVGVNIRIADVENYQYGFFADVNYPIGGYGAYLKHTAAGSGSYGVYAEGNFTGIGNPSFTYGGHFRANSTTQDCYGVYCDARMTSASSAGFAKGIYSNVNNAGTGPTYGIQINASGNGTVYGIYSEATGGTPRWAGYFVGNGYFSGNVGIGTTIPTAKLHALAYDSVGAKLVYHASPAVGINHYVGAEGYSGSNVIGRLGSRVSTLFGTSAYGVYGLSNLSGTNNFGVYGSAANGTQNFGIYGESTSDSNYAVAGFMSGTTIGKFDSTWTGWTPSAVFGGRNGVIGFTSTSSGYAVVGYSHKGARGVYGLADSGSTNYGVYGSARNATSTGYGIYASATGAATNWAGYFSGNVNITGSISKGSGSFLIDHPLDPLNKTLRHNFVESPENLCLYRGKTILDSSGKATIKMPDYFIALTKEDGATVTLTPIGETPFLVSYKWNADHSAFTIYGIAGGEVSYQVLADRDDPVMRELYRPVEEEKGTNNNGWTKGKLLYPTAYGYPEEMGQDYESNHPEQK